MLGMESPDFLKNKYNLHNAPEVERAVEAKERKTKRKVPETPEAKIQTYLDRLKNIINPPKHEGHSEFDRQERNLNLLKQALHNQFVTKPDDIPESYYAAQQRIAREQGHGDIEISEAMKRQLVEVIVADQKSTLDNWVDYLTSEDATYPDWLKYWTMRSVLGMGGYDKGKHQFTKRSKGTTKPFPEINREALAYVLDAVSQKYGKRHTDLLNLNEGEKQEFNKLLEQENFPKLYAWALEKVAIAPTEESLENTSGKWIKYSKNSNHMPLVESLRGHGTGWCTAGEGVAQTQLNGGDFYVYYSLDRHGKPTIPRAAIRMQEGSIAEVRGVAEQQNLDPYIAPIVQDKMKEFPDGEAYEKKAQDIKLLTAIEHKTKTNEPPTKDDLTFLYELNAPIEGFGYDRDPRIQELRTQRNIHEDMPIIFECTNDQIAHNAKEINETTIAYVGPIEKNIFTKLQEHHIEYIYTSFPEGKIQKYYIQIGGKTKEELQTELEEKNINLSEWAKDLLNSKDFTTSKVIEGTDLVRLSVNDLGFPQGATTKEIYQRAKEYGLELCPAEVGPHLRLQYRISDWTLIAMKQITGRGGYPSVFYMDRGAVGLWLSTSDARPSRGWSSDGWFVFRLRKLES